MFINQLYLLFESVFFNSYKVVSKRYTYFIKFIYFIFFLVGINDQCESSAARLVFLYGLFFLGYKYMTVAWQGNLTTTTVTLEKDNNDFNKAEKSYKTRHT